MKILFATSECAPFSKSGGLADVAFSLPPALKKARNTTAIITPYYKCVKERFADQIKLVKETHGSSAMPICTAACSKANCPASRSGRSSTG